MLKTYQVAETKNNTWIVVKTCTEVLDNNELDGNLSSIDYDEFSTAAEAQEKADELNEDTE